MLAVVRRIVCATAVVGEILWALGCACERKDDIAQTIQGMQTWCAECTNSGEVFWRKENEWVNKPAHYGRDALEPVVTCYRAHHGSKDPTNKVVAMSMLRVVGRIDDRGAVPDLLRLAKGSDSRLSYFAIKGLGRSCTKDHLDDIVTLISSLPRDWVANREAAVEVVGKFRGDDVRRLLGDYLGDRDPALRRGALRAIARSRDASFLPFVSRALRSDTDPYVRGVAAETAARLGDETGTRYLMGLLDPRGSRKDIYIGARGLERLKEASAVSKLTDLLRHEDVDVRFWALGALWAIGTPEAIRVLKEAGLDEWRPLKDPEEAE